jgi:hypothetical protein
MAVRYNAAGEMVAEMILCQGRHECPCKDDGIFENEVAPMAFPKLELEAINKLKPLKLQGLKRLVIYTTGCTTALIAAINAATKLHIRDVILMHYDPRNDGYQEQKVATYADVYL